MTTLEQKFNSLHEYLKTVNGIVKKYEKSGETTFTISTVDRGVNLISDIADVITKWTNDRDCTFEAFDTHGRQLYNEIHMNVDINGQMVTFKNICV